MMRRTYSVLLRRHRCLVWVLALSPSVDKSLAVTIDWVTIGDPGNVADDTGLGAVADSYRIGKFEVTNSQYAEFLNAVAADDPVGLYNTNMDVTNTRMSPASRFGGISRSGRRGSYSYTAQEGREDKPVVFVSFADSLRFANWLHNSQPKGAQGPNTTEDGAYAISRIGLSNNSVTRNTNARVFLPSEDEWYKAAYYKTGGTNAGYWEYPTGTNEVPTAESPPGGSNSAHFNTEVSIADLTDVGAYTFSESPYGTFDQAGNVSEWNEAFIPESQGIFWRRLRGGSWLEPSGPMSASVPARTFPSLETQTTGFRVASVPEPEGLILCMFSFFFLMLWNRNHKRRRNAGVSSDQI